MLTGLKTVSSITSTFNKYLLNIRMSDLFDAFRTGFCEADAIVIISISQG